MKNPGKFSSIRPANSGDILVMLALRAGCMTPALENHLNLLKSVVSGESPDFLHLTLQRFEAGDYLMGSQFFELLHKQPGLSPVQVSADGFQSLFSESWNYHILKWTVPGTELLGQWYSIVDQLGEEVGMQPLYHRWGNEALVTALRDINIHNLGGLDEIEIPRPLMDVDHVIISRIVQLGQFETVGEFTLKK